MVNASCQVWKKIKFFKISAFLKMDPVKNGSGVFCCKRKKFNTEAS